MEYSARPSLNRWQSITRLEVKALALGDERFTDAMAALSSLRGPVDAFFEHVTVNCDDQNVRVNRLKLLAQIGQALDGIADFSKLEG